MEYNSNIIVSCSPTINKIFNEHFLSRIYTLVETAMTSYVGVKYLGLCNVLTCGSFGRRGCFFGFIINMIREHGWSHPQTAFLCDLVKVVWTGVRDYREGERGGGGIHMQKLKLMMWNFPIWRPRNIKEFRQNRYCIIIQVMSL